MADVVINEERFSAADVSIEMLGRVLTSCRMLNYDRTQDVTEFAAIGNRKTAGYSRGNDRSNGEIQLGEEEFLGIVRAAGGDVFKINPFPITVVMKKSSGLITKEVLEGVMFKGQGKNISADSSDGLVRAIPLRVADIKYPV
ncbi:MAG: hypothetical protein F9K23_00700 [Bacteroidetes bacterium]|nr:MAG: hypothetical protein F9K23_00700 [Bacteroidota bacterium]